MAKKFAKSGHTVQDISISKMKSLSHLIFERVNFSFKLFVLVGPVEEGEVDNVAGVLEGKRGLLVSGLTQVNPVHRDDLVAATNLRLFRLSVSVLLKFNKVC